MNVLREAEMLVGGDRNASYGHPADDFARIAGLWGVYLGRDITAQDVGMLLVLLKVAREAHTHKRDNLTDIAGYALCTELALERAANPMPEFGP